MNSEFILKILILGLFLVVVVALCGCQASVSDLGANSTSVVGDRREVSVINDNTPKFKGLSTESIGATFPKTVYCDGEEVIVHDFHCIFVYSLLEREVKDCLFEDDIGFSIPLQGDDAVCVNTKNNGEEIYVTSFEKNKIYVYDCKNRTGRSTGIPEKWIQNYDNRHDLSGLGLDVINESDIFKDDESVHDEQTLSDASVIYWTVEGDATTYKDYRFVLYKDGEYNKYSVFGE